jgi:hypothetical protein
MGIAGTGVVSAFTGMEKAGAGFPIKVAIACSYKARLVAMPVPAASAFCRVTSASAMDSSLSMPVSTDARVRSSAFLSASIVRLYLVL